jgi:hypothetical protein
MFLSVNGTAQSYGAASARYLRGDEWRAVEAAFDFLEGINEFDALYRGGKGRKRHRLDEQGRAQIELG